MTDAREAYLSSPIAVAIEDLSKFYPRAFRIDSKGASRPWPFNRFGGSATRAGDAPVDEDLGIDEEEEEAVDEIEEPEVAEERMGDVWALRDVDLVVERGTSMALIGDNGAGKTTLLRILTRALPPTKGRVQLYGRVSPFISLASLFTQPELTGRENVHGFAQFFEIPDEIVDRRIGAVAEFAELGHHFDLKVKTYSSGLVNRLAFSTVVNLDPEILLADAVVAVGDKGFRKRCVGRIREAIDSEGATLLFASHDLNLARDLCSDAVWLHEGRVEAMGKVDEVVDQYERHEGAGAGVPGARPAEEGAPAGDTAPATGEQPADAERTDVSEHGSVQEVGLYSMRGEAMTSARIDEDLLLEITINVPVPRAKVRCVFVLMTETGAKLRVRQPEPFPVYTPGDYTASVLLPAGSLAEGAYDVRAGAQLSVGRDKTAIVRDRAFSFDAFDPEGGPVSDEGEPGEGGEELGGSDLSELAWDVATNLKRRLRA